MKFILVMKHIIFYWQTFYSDITNFSKFLDVMQNFDKVLSYNPGLVN